MEPERTDKRSGDLDDIAILNYKIQLKIKKMPIMHKNRRIFRNGRNYQMDCYHFEPI